MLSIDHHNKTCHDQQLNATYESHELTVSLLSEEILDYVSENPSSLETLGTTLQNISTRDLILDHSLPYTISEWMT